MFAEMPLDYRTVDHVAALRRLQGSLAGAGWNITAIRKRSNISLRLIVL